jgi:hypothetical protein
MEILIWFKILVINLKLKSIMKNKLFKLLLVSISVLSLSSCVKNDDILLTRNEVEIDWAAFNARTSGYPFTLFTRVPQEPGRGVYNSANAYGGIDPILNRSFTDTIRMRINLTGSQLSTAQTFEMRVEPTFTTAIEGTAGAPGAHFQLIDRTVTIPANSSFGFCRWVVRNPGVTNNLPVTVCFRLVGNSQINVAENFKFIGWSITQ